MKKLIIAIDGPSGAGKGTIARTLSEHLGYRHIDTGAMYRAVGWMATHDGVPLDDEAGVASVARHAAIVVEGGVVSIDGHDVTRAIRTPRWTRPRRRWRGFRACARSSSRVSAATAKAAAS